MPVEDELKEAEKLLSILTDKHQEVLGEEIKLFPPAIRELIRSLPKSIESNDDSYVKEASYLDIENKWKIKCPSKYRPGLEAMERVLRERTDNLENSLLTVSNQLKQQGLLPNLKSNVSSLNLVKQIVKETEENFSSQKKIDSLFDCLQRYQNALKQFNQTYHKDFKTWIVDVPEPGLIGIGEKIKSIMDKFKSLEEALQSLAKACKASKNLQSRSGKKSPLDRLIVLRSSN
eukprot:g359.t1